jgi:hypothetical protein
MRVLVGLRPAAAAIVAILLASLPAIGDTTLLRNGDFEAPFAKAADIADSWTPWGFDVPQTAERISRDMVNPHGGQACLKFSRAGNPKNWSGVIVTSPFKNHLVPEQGARYTLRFWARTDRPGPMQVLALSYRTLKPMEAGPQVATADFELTDAWQEFSLSFTAGLDFLVGDARHIYFTFFPAVGPESLKLDKTLWLDDVSLTKEPAGPELAGLVDPASLDIAPVPLRMRPGPALELTVRTKKKLRPVTPTVGGSSISGLARWGGPFSAQGDYTLAPGAEAAVREMRLPLTRLYGLVDGEPFPTVETALDKAAWLLGKLEIPRDTSMIELEDVFANSKLPPADWGRAAAHSVKQGLGFRHWEVGNEIYVGLFGIGHGKAFPTPDAYVEHAVAVSKAIKEAQPDARVGISIYTASPLWSNYVLHRARGHYDFVCPHFYGFSKVGQKTFEEIVIADNHTRVTDARKLNALLAAYNPDREVCIYDSEWGMHSSSPSGGQPWTEPKNANILGTVYRAIRMLYYVREGLVGGASGWVLFSSSANPGFLTIATDKPDQRSMLFWLHHFFNTSLGADVVDVAGTGPFFTGKDCKGPPLAPLTPSLATLSADGKALQLMLVNGSWADDVPARVALPDFAASRGTGVLLRHDGLEAQPLLARKEDFVHELPIEVSREGVQFTLPSHSIVFITLEKEDRRP